MTTPEEASKSALSEGPPSYLSTLPADGSSNLPRATLLEGRVTLPPQSLSPSLQAEIVNLSLWMKKEGYAYWTIRNTSMNLRMIARHLGTLIDGEAVKTWVAELKVRGGWKLSLLKAYARYSKWKGVKFEMPRVPDAEPRLPHVPLGEDIDSIISGAGTKLSAVLQLLKETGARIGETATLRWRDLDPDTGIINILAEKGSKSRTFKLSPKLVAMLLGLPRKNDYILARASIASLRANLYKTRARLAVKLGSERLRRVSFHSIRHYYGCRTYRTSKDLLYTRDRLGHRDVNSTMLYLTLTSWEEEGQYHVRASRELKQAEELVQQGFEFVCTMPDESRVFRKRK